MRGRTDRKSGGRPGHAGVTRLRVDNPDRIIDHFPEVCPSCRASLPTELESKRYKSRQVIVAPPRWELVEEHRVHFCDCPLCGESAKGTYPKNVASAVQFDKSVADLVVYTPAVSGVPANFLADSLKVAGIDPQTANKPEFDLGLELACALEKGEKRPWRDIWSAGHGVDGMSDLPAAAELIARMKGEYLKANAAKQARADSWSRQERKRRS